MTSTERIELYKRQAAILERIASQYPEGTEEYKAVRQAAVALFHALTQQKEDFLTYFGKWNQENLTPEQVAHLESMGIDADAIDEP